MPNRLRIVVGSVDAGYSYKEALKRDLRDDARVQQVTDMGVGADERTAYPHVAVAAARLVAEGKADRALLVSKALAAPFIAQPVQRGEHRVVLVVFPDIQLLDLVGPLEVFSMADRFSDGE